MIFLYHEDSFEAIKKKIKENDVTMGVGLKPLTNKICIDAYEEFLKGEPKIKKTI